MRRATTAFTGSKPHQGVLEFEGSTDNNLVWMGPGINLAPFRDDSPNARDGERYKAFVRVKRELFAIASPDGIRWSKMREEPVLTEWPFDTLNIPFWDTWRGEYVAYTRGVAGTGPFHRGRTLDTPHHVRQLPRLDRAYRHRHRRRAHGAVLHKLVRPVRAGPGHLPHVSIKVRI